VIRSLFFDGIAYIVKASHDLLPEGQLHVDKPRIASSLCSELVYFVSNTAHSKEAGLDSVECRI
jgi:hypothetical protein